MIAITDYGVGNLFSLKSSFNAVGHDVKVTSDPEELKKADKIILPGVGAFSDAAAKLKNSGLEKTLVDEALNGKPLLGICLGMQLLFDKSFEYGEHKGLGLIPGVVKHIHEASPKNYKIPHIGWNNLIFVKDSPLFKRIKNGAHVYFVHSFFASECDESTIAVTEYGAPLTAAVQKGNIFGCQFHPEKSGETGLNIIKSFCEDI